jgi:DNA-binding response OmpR family regulator
MSYFDRLSDVPIVMLLEREQDGWLARQAGAAHVLVKPVETSALVDAALALVRPAAS